MFWLLIATMLLIAGIVLAGWCLLVAASSADDRHDAP